MQVGDLEWTRLGETDGEGPPHQKKLGGARGWEEKAAKRTEGSLGGDGEVRASQQGRTVLSLFLLALRENIEKYVG